MLKGRTILAVVTARKGSKGIPDKNMVLLKGRSLIGWAGAVLAQLHFLDAKIISTDSPEYAKEGEKYGLDAPFLRPAHLSTDEASSIDTIHHALEESENYYKFRFDIVIIVEPTSPLRKPEDIERAIMKLITTGADSVVTVSRLDKKYHPLKVLTILGDRLSFLNTEGERIYRRQMLDELYWRNGVCYVLSRECLFMKKIFTANTVAEITEHPVVNIDYLLELKWAEKLLELEEDGFDQRNL
jgi:CMP-N-acetylneuraminic acid synthetase